MPTYRVYIDGIDTGDIVSAETFVDAYFDVSSTHPLTYQNDVRLMEVQSPENLS